MGLGPGEGWARWEPAEQRDLEAGTRLVQTDVGKVGIDCLSDGLLA